jgi:hypothetical protein
MKNVISGLRPSWVLAATLTLGFPCALMAQEDCGNCYWDDNVNEHEIWYSELDADYDCYSKSGAECDGCHYWPVLGSCEGSHGVCDPETEEDELPVLPESVMLIVERERVGELRDLLSSASNVEFNSERQAIQVLDCRGLVAAHIPVSTSLGESLSANMLVL